MNIPCLTKLIRSSATILGVAATFSSVALAENTRGKQLYQNCVACHQADGSGSELLKAPALNNLSAKHIADQLVKFHDGIRGGNVNDQTGLQMRPMSMTITNDEDRAAVSEYVATMSSTPKKASIEGGNAEAGKMKYMICSTCHGADGKGNDLLNAPSLVHQYDWYLEAQLKKFKEGVRGSDPKDITGAQMRPMAMMLADEQSVKDVIAYIQSLSE